jgi:tartrate-resistant acid phosphatase type 5
MVKSRSTGLWTLLLGAWPLMAGSVSSLHASTTLAVIGDWGSGTADSTHVANMVASSAWQTDYVLTVGDNTYGNVAPGHADWETFVGARYGRYMKRRTGQQSPYPSQTSSVQRFFPTVGNHDRDATLSGYIDYFHLDPGHPAGRLPAGVHSEEQSYYDFEVPIEGGVQSIHVFAMDSESFLTSAPHQAAQIAWLREGLRTSAAAWDFVLLHRPPFSSGAHGSSPLVQLPFQQWGADAVLAGHDHLYERLRVTDASQNDMLYVVDGAGGRELYSFGSPAPGSEFRYNENFGAMRITVTDEEARFEFLAVESGDEGTEGGTLIDSFTRLKSRVPTPPVLTADFDGDGFVNNHDLATWTTAAAATSAQGDADGDGDSDGADFLAWQRQLSSFQAIPPIPPSTVNLPEPGLGLTAALAVGAMRWGARSRRMPLVTI